MLQKPLRAQIRIVDPDNLPGSFTTKDYVLGRILSDIRVLTGGRHLEEEIWWWLRLDEALLIDRKIERAIETEDLLLRPGDPGADSLFAREDPARVGEDYCVQVILVPEVEVAELERIRVTRAIIRRDKAGFRYINAGRLRILQEE